MRIRYEVSDLRLVDQITGFGYSDQWDVCGTDLGIPVYSPSQQRMYFLFGDTNGVGAHYPEKGTPNWRGDIRNWRGTVAGYITDFNLTDGLNWAGFLSHPDGKAKALIEAHYLTSKAHDEVSKICQGGIEIDGALYCFYESIRFWDPIETGYQRRWYVNYSGVIKSTDGGETFERVYDLSWVETDKGENRWNIKKLVEEDMNHQPSGYDFDISSHVAPGFGQMYACDGKDGYIYIYGRWGGRISGIKVGRVKRDKFETFAEYEYLTRFDGAKPVWVKGKAGLDILLEQEARCDVIPGPCSNMAVSYNHYLAKWILTYYKPGVGIMYSLSDTPYGPYNEIKYLLPIDHSMLTEDMPEGGNVLYGGFTHELLNQENGRKLMLIISQWYPKTESRPGFYNSKLVEITFERQTYDYRNTTTVSAKRKAAREMQAKAADVNYR